MAKSPHLSAQEHAATFTNKRRTIALIIVAIAFVMDLLDSTIVNIAIPSIRTNLSASYSSIQWVVAGYSLAFSVLLVTGGRMGDVFGYKKLFMIGMGGFTIASLLSGLSQDPSMLITARLIQGSMAALMVPQVMSLMQVMYKVEERGAINGLFGTLGGLSASLGPVVGGLLIKANVFNLDWRPIFLINLPIGIFGMLAAIKYLPNGKSSHPLKFDFLGTFLVMAAMILLVYPLIQGRDLGWPLWTYLMMASSLPVFALFWWWQNKKDSIDGSPLILPALFKNRSFGVGLSVNLIFEMAIIGYFLTFGLLLQIGLGFSPIHAALTGLPVALGIGTTMAVLGEKFIPKLGRKALNVGTVVMTAGILVTIEILHLYQLGIHSWQLIPGLLLIGIGMGFIFGTLFAVVLNGVDAKHAGSASGTLNAIQQVGAAIGVALIGVVFFGQLNHAAPASFISVESSLKTSLTEQHIPVQEQSIIVRNVKACFVERSQEKDSTVIPPICNEKSSSSVAFIKTVSTEAEKANSVNFDNAFKWSMIYAISLLVVTFCVAYLLPSKFKTESYKEA
jgi:EmrB/QacA subfamily drug resistance transporter